MENNTISVLQDYQTSINSSFKKIEGLFDQVLETDSSQQNLTINNIKSELYNVKYFINLMLFEKANLQEENNEYKWKEIVSQINRNYDYYRLHLEKLKNNQSNFENDDTLNILIYQ